MNNEEKDKTLLDSIVVYSNDMGITGSKPEWWNLALLATKIGGFASKEEIDSVKSRIAQENRNGKIESIVDDKPFTEKKLEEDQEYRDLMKRRVNPMSSPGVTPMSGPSGKLFYLDFAHRNFMPCVPLL